MTSPSVSGWYPDPFGRFRVRWWDGARWTEYVADTDVGWDAVPLEEVRAQRQALPGVGAGIVGFGAGVGLATVGLLALKRADSPGGRVAELLVGASGLWVGLVVACLFVSRRRGTGSPVRDFGLRFRWRDVGLGFAGSLVARLLSVSAVAPIPLPTRRIGEPERRVFEEALDAGPELLVLVLVTCVGAPVIEELFFRGLVQSRLEVRLGVAPGIAISSLLFGMAHLLAWQGPWTFAYAWAVAAGGVALGLMRHVTDRLGPSIIAHAFFNAQAMVTVALLG